MNTPSSSMICILLVGGNAANVAGLSFLLSSKYKVMIAQTGSGALYFLTKPLHGVDLVMVHTGLPDICSFDLMRIVDKQLQLPVVMICESPDLLTMSRASSSGALGAYVHPLSSEDIINLWQLPSVKRAMVNLAESHARYAANQSKKRKIDGGSLGQCLKLRVSINRYLVSVGIWRFFNLAMGAPRAYAPGVTGNSKLVARRLELPMAAQPTIPDTDSDDDVEELLDERDGPSFLAQYLEYPYSRGQLKRVIQIAELKWNLWKGQPRALIPPPPPPPSELPLVSLPASLARHIEKFIHTTNAFKYAAGTRTIDQIYQLALEVESRGPNGSSELPEGEEELDADDIDTDDIYDAMLELCDDNV